MQPLTRTPAGETPGAPAPGRNLTPGQIAGIVAVTVFIATELLAASSAFVWAAAGLLHLGLAGTGIAGVVIGLPTLYAIGKTAVLAYSSEIDPENDPRSVY